jgi:hypothetical protein
VRNQIVILDTSLMAPDVSSSRPPTRLAFEHEGSAMTSPVLQMDNA